MLNKMRLCVLEKTLGSIIGCLLLFGITTPPGLAVAQESPKLKVVVTAGEGATNNIKLRLNRELIVQVTDENNKPVAGAAVLFTLPEIGAGGTFQGAGKMLAVESNEQGLAVAKGFVPNDTVGNFEIEVQASYQGQVATTTIAQTNAIVGGAAAAGGISGALIGVLIGGAVAGAVLGIKAAGGGKKDNDNHDDIIIHATIGLDGGPTLTEP
jgi:hypothetical protein